MTTNVGSPLLTERREGFPKNNYSRGIQHSIISTGRESHRDHGLAVRGGRGRVLEVHKVDELGLGVRRLRHLRRR